MTQDEKYMKRCLDLALLGGSSVSPNPMVGAVIVHEDKIIGEGYTSPYGGPHAEVNAVNDTIQCYGETEANCLFQQSTLYVSLEPCAHFGRTPPCADLIVRLRFKKVVIGCMDIFAKVNGEGIRKLKVAGIDTVVGLLEEECKYINRRFFTRIQQQRPYVILKWAQTQNGKFAPEENEQRWISNNASKQLVHKWRAEEDAILVGTRTALVDNPSLTVRLWKGKHPKRILIDRDLSLPIDSAIFSSDAETIIFNAVKTDWQGHIKYIELENFGLYLPQNILYQLYLMDVQSIIIEGGAKTLQSFIDAKVWDEARIFISPQQWETGIKAPTFEGTICREEKIAQDKLVVYERR
ncbi:bifunctional diaminohydroxyphosphoribosylaminopyrimidine deaminase/5-amino-6-(5-phosphoribosylamino)uracil reductase RibD [Sphingobacterium wenxiniae]|uniref:Riboflavin biosynthesis protein RibD n=1 Tax=Sphingobacterium wenxiniae TaxID=683125 RepID=A0A1I6QGK2_9SPHI|nr:bifunctional diaminohydroxyphosphoribosylaminopyrimidine deaminase/5-amino-6-(5-phosphoribosylamino)uracil reductase RibD [Sphingobacterium wenxiniae]SFS51586.1 diaminohydroxyphosphoribosylaminopyrimidine deaminase [Sphingobacterium wenxiniae]